MFASEWLFPWLGLAAGVLCIFFALKNARFQKLIENLPTCKTSGVFIGLVELKGTAESESPLRSYLVEISNVYYQWKIEEKWSRLVTETYTDSKGRVQTRTRMESGWKTVGEGGEMEIFYLKDSEGAILIRPEGAKLGTEKVMEKICGREDPLYYGKGPAQSIPDSTHTRRFLEYAIPLHAPVYVVGRSRERNDVVAPEIASDSSGNLYLISTHSEEAVRKGYRGLFWMLEIFGFIFLWGGFAVRDWQNQSVAELNLSLYFTLGISYLMVSMMGWMIMVYNSMVDLLQRVNQAWANIDVELKRRNDLIPNLVTAVHGLKDFEKNLQTEIAALRSQLSLTPPGQAGPDPQGCTPILFAVAEKYPELKTQDSFLNLQKNLIETEQRIALARGYFNEIATFYNTRLQIVPDGWIAALGRFKPRMLMGTADFERSPVKVQFAE